MKRLRNTILLVLLAVLAAVIALAWYDGGRQEQRMIVQPVAVADGES